jgi:hypothetical protein
MSYFLILPTQLFNKKYFDNEHKKCKFIIHGCTDETGRSRNYHTQLRKCSELGTLKGYSLGDFCN